VAQDALEHRGCDDLGLFAGRGNDLPRLRNVSVPTPSMVPRRGCCDACGGSLRGLGCDAQYSSARMIVRARVVTAGSAGGGEPISVARS
jgi:hypothetical protein